MLISILFFKRYGHHRDLHSFPYTTLFRSTLEQVRRFLGRTLQDPYGRAFGKVVGISANLRDEVTGVGIDRKSTRLNSSHTVISYAVFCLKKKKQCVQKGKLLHHTIKRDDL